MSESRCICCGEIVPEGRQVCFRCEKRVAKSNPQYVASITDRYGAEYNYTGLMEEVVRWGEAMMQTSLTDEVRIRRMK